MASVTDLPGLRMWLQGLLLEKYAEAFFKQGWVGDRLLDITREDLADLSIPKNQRWYVILAVDALRTGDAWPRFEQPQASGYARNLTDEVQKRCHELAAQPPVAWVSEVMGQWPGPIAHEYWRFKELLSQRQVVPAILQFRDLAEVLIKFPALILTRDIIEHGSHTHQQELRRRLFSGPLSLGYWLALLRDGIVQPLRNPETASQLTLKPLFEFYTSERGRDWFEQLGKWLDWRNKEIGHGAFRLDFGEYLNELQDFVAQLNSSLEQQAGTGFWQSVRLHGGTDSPIELTGWQAIHHWHDSETSKHKQRQPLPLYLQYQDKDLPLAPYVMLRRCGICCQQDVFLYDSRSTHSDNAAFQLQDYIKGHRLQLHTYQADGMALEAQGLEQPSSAPLPEGELGEDYHDSAIIGLLESKALQARYLRPVYLQQPLQAFLKQHDRGIFWLSAPGHVGKSLFVQGLVQENGQQADNPRLGTGIRVAAFHIRREYKVWPEQLRSFLLEDVVRGLFGKEPAQLGLPELDTQSNDPAAAFIELLHHLELKSPITQCIICLDGLDELPPMPDGTASIAAFIPEPDQLPQGFYLLLTSRPEADTPDYVRKQLAGKFQRQPDFSHIELTLPQPGQMQHDALTDAYLKLLKDYFNRELRERMASDLHHAMESVVEQATDQTLTVQANDLSQYLPPPLQETVKQDWRQLTDGLTLSAKAGAPQLGKEILAPVMEQYQQAYRFMLEKSGHRFLYFAHLVELFQDRKLDFNDLGPLPEAGGLYKYYLEQLQRVLGADQPNSKPWEFTRRLLLTLAAAEQAFTTFQSFLPAACRSTDFTGVPLSILAELMVEPARSTRLLFTLYTVKESLAVWKGEDARDANYALGLKDLIFTIQALWPDALIEQHHKLAMTLFDVLARNWEEVSLDNVIDNWAIRFGYAHAKLSEERETMNQWGVQEFHDCLAELEKMASTKISYKQSIELCSVNIAILEKFQYLSELDCQSDKAKALARGYLDRGNALGSRNNNLAALDDYCRAIELMEALRHRLADKWPLDWSNDLARVYLDRGLAYQNRSDYTEALDDYLRAIELREALRDCLGDEWPPAWANELAMAYANLGMLHWNRDDHAAALVFYSQAIELRESLRQRLGEEWSLAWGNVLAGFYTSRGQVHQNRSEYTAALADFVRAIELMESLRERLGDEWPSAWANDLAMTYSNLGILYWNRNDHVAALAYYRQAIELGEALRQRLGKEWPPAWANSLAMVYMNRGIVHDNLNNYPTALTDYRQAIELREALRQKLGDEWPPAWANDLAMTYSNLGILYWNRNDHVAALAYYRQAIELGESLRQRLDDECPPSWTHYLAGAYMNRAVAHRALIDYKAALYDYNRTIELMEALRQRMGDEWPSAWANDLARVFCNRAIVHKMGNDYQAALDDNRRAIELGEALRQRLGDECPPHWTHNLAAAYTNQAIVQGKRIDYKAALANNCQAIELMEVLREQVGDKWPPDWDHDLAVAYSRQANVQCERLDYKAELANIRRAIVLMEDLRGRLGEESPPNWDNDLADYYYNRGLYHSNRHDYASALADYSQAIELKEALRQRLGNNWPMDWGYNLAMAYNNRGSDHANRNNYSAALADYRQSIELKEALRQRLGDEWSPDWANDLAMVYANRGYVHRKRNDYPAALDDYRQTIELSEDLLQRLGKEYPMSWANDLASNYDNRAELYQAINDLPAAKADKRRAELIRNRLPKHSKLRSIGDTIRRLLKAIFR